MRRLPFTIAQALLLFSFLSPALSEEKTVYQKLWEALRSLDEVLPPVPDTHPVNTLYNAKAVVPSQCYTRTEARSNPCNVCHQDQIPDRENTMNDADLQEAYSFSDIGVKADGSIGVSMRMKEVRYMKKARAYSKLMYARKYTLEANEKEAGNLPAYQSIQHHGLDNGNGWAIQGFIEDRQGRLRSLT